MAKYKPIPLPLMPEKSDAEINRLAYLIYEKFSHRRTIRDFSKRSVPEEVIQNCIKVASMAPSGANHQPWHFVAISNIEIKTKIRQAAENEEKKFYSDLKNDEWINALEPIGTGPNKEHLSRAPWLIIIFAERYGMKDDGTRYKNYYVPESVGIATGFLISAIHQSGLYCLVHTPNPMKFLNQICNRPPSNKPLMIIAAGHPAKEAKIPLAAKIKKTLDKVLTIIR